MSYVSKRYKAAVLAKGDTGETGATGAVGATGATGAVGAKGDTGTQGAVGQQGSKGDTGSVGSTGSTGAVGATGSKGDQGIQGIQGVPGLQGLKGDTGATGATGTAGTNGTNGTNVVVSKTNVSITPGLIAVGTANYTVTVAGVLTTDVITVQPTVALPGGLFIAHWRVSAANTVVISLGTPLALGLNLGTAYTFQVAIIR